MNRNWKQIWIRFAMVLMLAVAIPFQSFAGNARIAFSDPTAEVGSEFTVNVKFTCTTGEKIGKTVVMLSYDTSAMEFIGGEPDVSGGNGAIRVIGSVSGSSESASTIRFKALKAGSSKIEVMTQMSSCWTLPSLEVLLLLLTAQAQRQRHLVTLPCPPFRFLLVP